MIYVPFLQQAFSTVSLSAGDWLRCAAVASSVLWLRELSKAGRLGALPFRSGALAADGMARGVQRGGPERMGTCLVTALMLL